MPKITDYTAKTAFDDGDLYDCSTFDGISAYATEKVTWLQLKNELSSTLTINSIYTANDSLTSPRTVTLSGTNTLTFTGGLTTFVGQDATSSNYSAKFQDSANVDILVVRNDNKVGVNSSTPTGAFEVSRISSEPDIALFGGSSVGGSVQIAHYLTDSLGNKVKASDGIRFRSFNVTSGSVVSDIVLGQIFKVQDNNERVLIKPSVFTGAAVAQLHLEGDSGSTPISFYVRSGGKTSERLMKLSNSDGDTGGEILNLYADGRFSYNHDNLSTADFQVKGLTDDNNFFIDASADRVGVGTNSPQKKLHVNGDIRVDGTTSGTSSGSSGTYLTINVGGTDYKLDLHTV